MSHHRYAAIPRVLCFLRHEGRWLLIRRAASCRLWPNLYNGVGGHVEEGEGIVAAAQRELEEEAGLQAETLRLRGVIHETEGDHGVIVFVFTGTCRTGELRASPEGTPRWISDGELLDLDLVADVELILRRLLAMAPEDPPFLARSRVDAAWRPQLVFEE
jgi:8-oxo-dGTP diphosphatase